MQVTVARRPPLSADEAKVTGHWRAAGPSRISSIIWSGGAITVLAYGLRCWLLAVPSFWYDEGVSWSLARQPVAALLSQLARADFNPPLYLVLLHVWLQPAGDSEYALRYLSVIAGTLVAPLCWVVARRLFSALAAALTAALFAATSVFLIDFSQEARGYALAAALGLLSAYALVRILDWASPEMPARWWWTYLAATTAALYTHYAMLLLMPVHLLLVLVMHRRRLEVGAAWLAGTVLYLPWLASLGRQLAAMRTTPDFWAGHISPTLAPERVLAAISIAPGALPDQTRLLLAVGAVGLGLATFAALCAPVRSRVAALFPVQLVLLPLLEAALLTAIFPKFIDRYLLPVAPFAYVSLAGLAALAVAPNFARHRIAIATLGERVRRATLPAFTGLLLAASLGHALYHAPLTSVEVKDGNTRTVVAFIAAHAQQGDAVLLAQDTSTVFAYYARMSLAKEGIPWFGVVPEFSRGDDLPALAGALNAAARGHSRLWVVLWHTDFADPTGYLRNALDVGATRLLTDTAAANYELRLYQLRPNWQFSPKATPLQPMQVRLGQHITFLGVGLEEGVRPADLPFVVHTWFRTDAPLDRDYQAVLRLVRDGHVWTQLALRPSLYTYPAQHWLPGIDVPGRLVFQADAETPPADYHLTLALYDPETHQDLSAVDAERGAIGTQVDLGVVKVLPPQRYGNLALPTHVLNLSVDRGLNLWGIAEVPTRVQQSASLELPLYWKAPGQPEADYQGRLELSPQGKAGTPLSVSTLAPPAPGLGTQHWPVGATFKDIRTMQIPPHAPVGPAVLQLRIFAAGRQDTVLPLATITIDASPRNMSEPADIGTSVGMLFGDAALLAGVELDSSAAHPGGQVVVTLAWQCRRALDQNYTVFVHLLDAANTIGGRQHDGPPNGGSDPTTTWTPGQWITDRHVVPLPDSTPAGTYRLEVGLYRQSSEQFLRLPLTTGGDAVIVGTVTVR